MGFKLPIDMTKTERIKLLIRTMRPSRMGAVLLFLPCAVGTALSMPETPLGFVVKLGIAYAFTCSAVWVAALLVGATKGNTYELSVDFASAILKEHGMEKASEATARLEDVDNDATRELIKGPITDVCTYLMETVSSSISADFKEDASKTLIVLVDQALLCDKTKDREESILKKLDERADK